MGALLLLLFIMDRRAKIAAQHSVSDAVAERKKRTQEEEAARQAEWEKATALLHQSLLEKEGELAGAASKIQVGLSEADQKLAVVQSQHVELEGKIQAESAQIARLQSYIASKNAGLNDVDKKETKSKIELLEATKELAELELAFRRLKAPSGAATRIPIRWGPLSRQTRRSAHADLCRMFARRRRLSPRKKIAPTLGLHRRHGAGRSGTPHRFPLAIEEIDQRTTERGMAPEHKGPYRAFSWYGPTASALITWPRRR